jgi:hypothetical protein
MMSIWRKWEIDVGTIYKIIAIYLVNNLTERSFWHESKIDYGLGFDGCCAVLEFHGKRRSAYGWHEGIGLVIQGFRRKCIFDGILGWKGAACQLC